MRAPTPSRISAASNDTANAPAIPVRSAASEAAASAIAAPPPGAGGDPSMSIRSVGESSAASRPASARAITASGTVG